MTDGALRELERAWRASGQPDDEARYIAEALRAGRLVRERVELAAYLRHAPARAALGDGAPAGEHVPWSAWVAAVDDDGRRALVRALVGAVRAAAHLEHEPVTRACDALEAWLAAPGLEHARALREARDALRVDPVGPEALAPAAAEPMLAAWCLREAALLVLAMGDDAVEGALRRVAAAARENALPWLEGGLGPLLDPLLAWALGPGHAYCPGDDEDAGRYVRERLRRGEVDASRLALAAYAGDAAARAALGERAPAPPADLEAWVRGLGAFDPALPGRVVAGVAGHVLLTPLTRAWLGAPCTPRGHAVRSVVVRQAREACAALRELAERPTEEARAALGRHAELLAPATIDRSAPTEQAARAVRALRAALACGQTGGEPLATLRAVREVAVATDEVDLLCRGLVEGWGRTG